MTHTITRTLAAAAIVAATLTLTACGEGGTPDNPGDGGGSAGVSAFDVNLPDGRTVTCVTWKAYNAGGISCDWEGAR